MNNKKRLLEVKNENILKFKTKYTIKKK